MAPQTEIVVAGGTSYRVDGEAKDVETQVVAAARGSIMELVWFSEAETGTPIALNPEHVVVLRAVI